MKRDIIDSLIIGSLIICLPFFTDVKTPIEYITGALGIAASIYLILREIRERKK